MTSTSEREGESGSALKWSDNNESFDKQKEEEAPQAKQQKTTINKQNGKSNK